MVSTVSVTVDFQTTHVVFCFRVRGDMARLRIPPEKDPARVDLLWEHTCFEVFVSHEGDSAYREFNFSTSGQWAAFDFVDYRSRTQEDPAVPAPSISTQLTDGRLELNAVMPLTTLPANPARKPLRIGVSAVIEAADTIDGGHSYWALHHPSPRPDFHHRAGFSLELPHSGFAGT